MAIAGFLKLEHVRIGPGMSEDCVVRELVSKCKSLRVLDARGCCHLTDDSTTLILWYASLLQELDLSFDEPDLDPNVDGNQGEDPAFPLRGRISRGPFSEEEDEPFALALAEAEAWSAGHNWQRGISNIQFQDQLPVHSVLLQKLNVSGSRHVGDAAFSQVIQFLPLLTDILATGTGIPSVGVASAVKFCPDLKQIDISEAAYTLPVTLHFMTLVARYPCLLIKFAGAPLQIL